ncbi:MAG TPA: RraA family protein [Candidatus Acidoferrales bacterium]
MNVEPLMPLQLEQLRSLSTCVVASAIETFGVRLRNRGFTDSRLHCFFPEMPTTVGYAATARIRSSDPPMEGHSYYERGAWWDSLRQIPEPRVVVVEDVDSNPGLGAFIGEVHANILLALGCIAVITNGAVRDLAGVRKSGLQMFAGNVSVSHAYAHAFDFAGTVEIAGLSVQPGDLIQGDQHGVQTIPRSIAPRVPAKALEILQQRKQLIEFCRSDSFSITKLRERLKELES